MSTRLSGVRSHVRISPNHSLSKSLGYAPVTSDAFVRGLDALAGRAVELPIDTLAAEILALKKVVAAGCSQVSASEARRAVALFEAVEFFAAVVRGTATAQEVRHD